MIINSLLDTDWYKILMGQVVLYQFPSLYVKYKFINRANTWFPEGFDVKLKEEIRNLATLKLLESEKMWLLNQEGITKYYADWLSKYSFNPNQVTVKLENKILEVEIEGKWKETIYWEVPLLAIISELYYKETNKILDWDLVNKNIRNKYYALEGVKFADFGTRRRFSYDVQKALVSHMVRGTNFIGTSNPSLAMVYNILPIGTYAHETVMAMSALYGINDANKEWLKNWRYIYGNNYNIALTDTYTTEIFFKTISQKDMLLIGGLRQDSGNPEEVAAKMINKLKEWGINPRDKKIIFSDNLNPEKAVRLYNKFKDKTNVIFGIGTNLTNDCGYSPLNMVIKLDSVLVQDLSLEWYFKPVVKLSDSKGKYTGDKEELTKILNEVEYV